MSKEASVHKRIPRQSLQRHQINWTENLRVPFLEQMNQEGWGPPNHSTAMLLSNQHNGKKK